jgi:hypothetical protein
MRIRNAELPKLRELMPDIPNITVSPWFRMDALEACKISYARMKRLIGLGFIEVRATDGFGNEYRLKNNPPA